MHYQINFHFHRDFYAHHLWRAATYWPHRQSVTNVIYFSQFNDQWVYLSQFNSSVVTTQAHIFRPQPTICSRSLFYFVPQLARPLLQCSGVHLVRFPSYGDFKVSWGTWLGYKYPSYPPNPNISSSTDFYISSFITPEFWITRFYPATDVTC